MTMTLDEAIKRIQSRIDGECYDFDPEDLSDLKLGIEGLKGIKKIRKTLRPYVEALLPGEAEVETETESVE